MQNGLYVAVSAQVALQRRLETIADNIANMNTVGYRATGVSFEAEMEKAGETTLDYVSARSDYLSRGAGGLIKTTILWTSPSRGTDGSASRRLPAWRTRAMAEPASPNPERCGR